MMRTKRLLSIAVIVTMSAFLLLCSTVAQTAPPAATPAPLTVGSPAVEVVKTLAWPMVVLLIAVGFRKPIALFLSALGSRITKLSVFKGLDALEDIHYEGMLQFLNGIDPEMEQRRREQLLDVNVHDVKTVAQKFLVDGMANARTMVIGSKAPSHELDWKEVAKPIRL